MALHASASTVTPDADVYELADDPGMTSSEEVLSPPTSPTLLPPPPPPAAQPSPAAAPAEAKEQAPANGKAAKDESKGAAAVARQLRRLRWSRRFNTPSWGVSVAVHIVMLIVLGVATFSAGEARLKITGIDSALIANPGGADELVKIWADPGNQARDQAAGGESGASAAAPAGGGGGAPGAFGGIGTGPPSNTPAVPGGGSNVNEKNALPGVKVVTQLSGLGLATLAAPSADLGGRGGITGDVTYGTKDIGEALDQLAREILRHLNQHKLTVVWLFDESESMKDDQKAIKQKFDRVAGELKIKLPASSRKKEAAALNHAIVGFGNGIDYVLRKPTLDVDMIGQAIDRLKIDETGVENTMHAISEVIGTYSNLISKERKLLIVLVTDESGDDGAYVEEARQAAVGRGVPLYVIGRQSVFGWPWVRFRYVDPVTKDVFYPAIRRGPETADVEVLQYDGLHDRWDEQPSGFAPYELARLVKETGGIYFLLPTEEAFRIHQREQAYSIHNMKELVPDYASRVEYSTRRNNSELRRSLYEIIQLTKSFKFRTAFPTELSEMLPLAAEGVSAADTRIPALVALQKRVEGLERLRDREPDKRWQANYDLLLAQLVTYQVKAFEYRACLEEMIKKKPKPREASNPPRLLVWWGLEHSRDAKAPKELTAKKYAEAERLLKRVIERYPKTPWADLAQDEIDRGFSVKWFEDHSTSSAQREEREKLVPKY